MGHAANKKKKKKKCIELFDHLYTFVAVKQIFGK